MMRVILLVISYPQLHKKKKMKNKRLAGKRLSASQARAAGRRPAGFRPRTRGLCLTGTGSDFSWPAASATLTFARDTTLLASCRRDRVRAFWIMMFSHGLWSGLRGGRYTHLPLQILKTFFLTNGRDTILPTCYATESYLNGCLL